MKSLPLSSFLFALATLSACQSAPEVLDASAPVQSGLLSIGPVSYRSSEAVSVQDHAAAMRLAAHTLSDLRGASSSEEAMSRLNQAAPSLRTTPQGREALFYVQAEVFDRFLLKDGVDAQERRHVATLVEAWAADGQTEPRLMAPALEALRGYWSEQKVEALASNVLAREQAQPSASASTDGQALRDHLGLDAVPTRAEPRQQLEALTQR